MSRTRPSAPSVTMKVGNASTRTWLKSWLACHDTGARKEELMGIGRKHLNTAGGARMWDGLQSGLRVRAGRVRESPPAYSAAECFRSEKRFPAIPEDGLRRW